MQQGHLYQRINLAVLGASQDTLGHILLSYV